jgi:hypothetical protein
VSTLTAVARLAARKVIEATDARADALLRAKHAENAADAHAKQAHEYGERLTAIRVDNLGLREEIRVRSGITDQEAVAVIAAVRDHVLTLDWRDVR